MWEGLDDEVKMSKSRRKKKEKMKIRKMVVWMKEMRGRGWGGR